MNTDDLKIGDRIKITGGTHAGKQGRVIKLSRTFVHYDLPGARTIDIPKRSE